MKISITGWTGVLGSKFIETYPNNQYLLFDGRVENFDDVKKFASTSENSDVILHFASLVPRRKVESNRLAALDANVKGTFNLLEAFSAIKNSDIHIIAVSTSHIYESASQKLKESDPKKPSSWYGETKLLSESICEFYRIDKGMKICNPRIFSYSGKKQSEDFFLPAMITKIKNAPTGAQLEIPGLLGSRDFISSLNVVQSIEHLIRLKHTGVVNIGSGRGIKLFEIVKLITEKLNRQDIVINCSLTENQNLVSDPTYMNSLGIVIQTEIGTIIDEIINQE